MSKNIFDEEPFRDGQPMYENGVWKEPEIFAPVPDNMARQTRALQPKTEIDPFEEEYDVDELTEQVAQDDDEDEDFTEVLSDVRLRLELGKLYNDVMNHDLFGGVDVDPRAAKTVQRQIRKFAKEQTEIMLGMRQEPALTAGVVVSSPFNELEVQILKKLASAASKGATESEEAQATEPQQIQTVQPPKKKSLNTIGDKQPVRQQPKPMAKPSKAISRKPEPIQRATRQRLLQERPPKELTGKSLHEMDEQEKTEYLRGVNERNKARAQVIPENRAPWPSFEQQVSIAEAQVSRAVGTPSKGNLSALIMSNLKSSGRL